MPVISAGDLTALRSEYQKTDVRISWLVPPILWQARISDGAIVKGTTSIAFDGGTGSFFSLVEGLQEVWVGSAAGANDTGRLRIKSISSGDAGVTGTLTVAGHSLPLQDDQYLTFLHDYPLKPKYSYIDLSENYFMDDNVTFTDQHTKPPPVVIAGSHRAGFLVSGTATFNVDASDSYTIASGATVSTYGLSVASTAGTPTVNFNTGTGLGYITFTAPGYYWAKYTVTDSNTKSQASYRLYILHNPDADDPSYPFVDCSAVQLEADWDNGGWTASVKAEDNMSLADIPDHTLCIVWHTPIYNDSVNYVTFLPDNNSAVFVGYVREDSGTQQMAEGFGEVDLTLSTVEGRLRRMFTFSTSLIVSKNAPVEWYEYEEWQTCGTIIHDLFLWRSTILEVADVIGLRDDTLNRMFQAFDEGNIYDNANNFLYSEGIRKRVLCDQGGRIHIASDQQLLVDADRGALTTAMEFVQTDAIADYGAALAIQRRPEFEAPFVTANGIYWDGATWDAEDRPEATGDYCSIAPGGKPLWEGPDPQDYPKQTVSSQDDLNKICGRYEAKINNPFVEIVLEFHGMYNTVLDIAYGEEYLIDFQSTETPRAIVWSNKPLYCRHVQAVYDGSVGIWEVSASFEPENITTDGVYTECPSFPELGGAIPPVVEPNDLPGALITGASVNFKPATGELWEQRLTQSVEDLVEDPFWRTKTGSLGPSHAIMFRCGVGYIKRTTDAFDTVDVDVTPSTSPPNDSADSPAPTNTTVTYSMGEGSGPTSGEFVFLAKWQNISGVWRSWLAYTDDNGATWTWKSLGGTPTLACQELSGIPVELDNGTITDIRGATWSLVNDTRQICEIDTDKYVVGYINNSSPYDIYVQVVNVGTGTPVLGVKKLTDLGGQTTAYGFTLCKVDTNKFAILDNYYANPQIQICVVSGSTITTGTATNWISAREISELVGASNIGSAQSNTAYAPTVCAPDASTLHIGRVGILVKDTGGATCTRNTGFDGFHFCKGTISSTTFTPDTIVCKAENINDWDTTLDGLPPRYTDHIRMSSSMSLAAYGYMGVGEVYSRLVAYDSSTGIGSTVQFASGGSPTNFRLVRLSDTKAILFFAEENFPDSKLFARVVTVSGTTITLGTNQLIYTYSGVSTYNLRTTEISSTEAAVIFVDNTGCQHMAKVTANTITNLITAYDTCAYGWPYVSTHDIYGIDGDDFLLLRDAATISGTAYDPSVTIGNYVAVLACSPGYSGPALALGLSIGRRFGNKVWVTANRSDELFLLEYALPALTESNAYSLGAATFAATIVKTWVAYPFVPWGYDDAVYIFGRMNNPQSLGSPAHIIRTTDGGSSFGLIEGSWDTDYCGALKLASSSYLFAIRNTDSGSKLYVDNADNVLVLKLTIPFYAHVVPHGMFLNFYTLDVYTIAWAAKSYMVSKIAPPHISATNLTYNHDTTAGGVSIIQL